MDPVVRQCLLVGGAGLISGAFCAFDAWWGRPTRRLARAHRWAGEQVATYDDEWLVPFQEQSAVARLVAGLAGFLALVLLFEVPLGGQPYAAVLLALPSVYGIVRGLSCTRTSLPPGTRVARLRELGLLDYIPQRTRIVMWFAGVVGCLACLLVAVVRHEWLLGVSGVLMVLAAGCVEVSGRRLARMPEPAQNASHVYLQDALRADRIRAVAISTVLSAAMLCNWLGSAAMDTEALWGALMVMNLVLLTGLFVVAFTPDKKASTYMRSRLWPQLRPGQLVTDVGAS